MKTTYNSPVTEILKLDVTCVICNESPTGDPGGGNITGGDNSFGNNAPWRY